MIKKEDIVKFCERVVCKWCNESPLKCKFIHHQCDIDMKLTCNKCHKTVIDETPDSIVFENKEYYQITLMLVYMTMVLGAGYRGVETLCGMLSLRHFTFETHTRYSTYVRRKMIQHVQNSRKVVFKFYEEKLNKIPNEDDKLDVDIRSDSL